MIDREKVIKGIARIERCLAPCICVDCPYKGKGKCVRILIEDAIALLKVDQLELIRQREQIERLKGEI